jgi:hypothetical protein
LKGIDVSMKRSRWRSWTALVAAYALALQTLFLAMSLGANAAQASAAELHVLCLSSGEAPDAPAPSHTAHQADCCVLGGNVLAKLLTPPPAGILAAPQAHAAQPAILAAETPTLSRHHSPLTARGPPRV